MTFKFTVEGSSLLSINFTSSEQEVDIYVKLLGNPMIGLNGWRQRPRCGTLNLKHNKLEQGGFNASYIIILLFLLLITIDE